MDNNLLKIGDVIKLQAGTKVEAQLSENNNAEIQIGILSYKDISEGEYVVISTVFNGGSYGHDAYPSGHNVSCKRLNKGKYNSKARVVSFYQSGCFRVMIKPEEIQPIREMKMTFI